MREALSTSLAVSLAMGVAACNPPAPPPPRVPHFTYAEFDKNPVATDKYWSVCERINASGTMTKLEDLRCQALDQFAATYTAIHHRPPPRS